MPPRIPAIDAVEMIEPPPTLRISEIEYLMPKKTPRSRIAWVRSQLSAVISSSAPTAPIKPALLKVTSRRPNSLTAPDQSFDVGLGCDVGLLKNGTAAVLLTLTDRRCAAFLIQIGDHDGGTLAGRALNRRC